MSETVLATLISSLLLLAGTVITVTASARSTRDGLRRDFEVHKAEVRGQTELLRAELQTLSARVEKHNSVVERTYALERELAVLKAERTGSE